MKSERSISVEIMLQSLLEEKKYNTLKDVLTTMNPVDIASVLEDLSQDVISRLFRLLPKGLAAETFVEMHPDLQQILIDGFSDAELRAVIGDMFVDDTADLIEEMPANVVNRILLQTDPEKRRIINEILQYPEDSAGSIMTTEYVSLRPDMSVGDALLRIRKVGVNKASIDTCFVIDDKRRLIGSATLRELILSAEETAVFDLLEPSVIYASTTDDQETVVEKFAKYDLTAVPVVDAEKRLVGIVTVDDAVDVLVEEATEDIEKMAAITPSDKPYLKTTVWRLWYSRIPWLLLLMISATFTGMIITGFEDALAAVVVLTAYIPMLMDTGGNCGSQASVSVIRSLSLGDVEFRDILRVLWKEFRVSLLCGITLAAVGFLKLMFLDNVGLNVSLVVSFTLLLTVVVAKITGCTLPLLAKRIGFDPAVCASPFITTIVDAISLLIYFGMAVTLLGI